MSALANRTGQGGAEHGVEEVDQQPPVGLGSQQGFEDAVDLRVDGVMHGGRGHGGGRGERGRSVEVAAAARQAQGSCRDRKSEADPIAPIPKIVVCPRFPPHTPGSAPRGSPRLLPLRANRPVLKGFP